MFPSAMQWTIPAVRLPRYFVNWFAAKNGMSVEYAPACPFRFMVRAR